MMMIQNKIIEKFNRLIEHSHIDIQNFKTNYLKPISEKGSSLFFNYPIHTKNEILWLFYYCQMLNINISDMKTVFFENYQETDEMINENPDVYQDHLNRDIIHTLNCFHPCKVFIDYDEFMDDIQKRTMFENLLGELSRFRSVEKEREKILLFDDMFRKLLPDLIRINYYTPDYISYAPDEYWWLHLIESYGSDSIYVKPVLRSRGYDIRRWHDSWPDNRNLWHYELYPNPGPGDYEKWRV